MAKKAKEVAGEVAEKGTTPPAAAGAVSEKKASAKSEKKVSAKAASEKKAKPAKQEKKQEAASGKRREIARATLRHFRMSPQKARLIVNLIRGKQVEPALQILQYSPTKSAVAAAKLLRSAISNAREHQGADIDKLWVTGCWVDSSTTMKRFMPGAQGRANPIRKRSSHMTIVVGEK